MIIACVLQEEEELIKPAVLGTENVLNAVNAAGTVQCVVITASTASVFTDGFERGEGHVFTEADWNVSATPTKFPYFYSKKLAEQVRLARQHLQDSCCVHDAVRCWCLAGAEEDPARARIASAASMQAKFSNVLMHNALVDQLEACKPIQSWSL
jgi:nucleoside-diphosphate-sugar epimerase